MINVIISESLKSVYIKYMLGLLLCVTRKTCTQMGAALGDRHDTITRALKKISQNKHNLQEIFLTIAYSLLNPKKKWWLIVDDSMVLKPHAKKLAQAILDYCGATGKIDRGLVAIFICITDGNIVIPINYKFWLNKKSCSMEEYRKKWEICIDLLRGLPQDFKHKNLLVDGAFANRFSLQILNELGFAFEARFRKNGKVTFNGVCKTISEHLDLLIFGPRLYSTVAGCWQGQKYFFTAHKHRNKSGCIITYTISNRTATAQEHAHDYCIRWGIEMFFRTAKQSLGIQDCSSTNIHMQIAHINCCIFSYTFLQIQRKKYRLSCVEEALHMLRASSLDTVRHNLSASHLFNYTFA